MTRRPDRARIVHALLSACDVLDLLESQGFQTWTLGRCNCGLSRAECIRETKKAEDRYIAAIASEAARKRAERRALRWGN